jgi:hypothetical protein
MCLGLEEERLQGCSCQQIEVVPASTSSTVARCVVWDTISNELVLCAARHTAQRSAVDTIHGGTNSDKPVTAIINAMQSDWNSML